MGKSVKARERCFLLSTEATGRHIQTKQTGGTLDKTLEERVQKHFAEKYSQICWDAQERKLNKFTKGMERIIAKLDKLREERLAHD